MSARRKTVTRVEKCSPTGQVAVQQLESDGMYWSRVCTLINVSLSKLTKTAHHWHTRISRNVTKWRIQQKWLEELLKARWLITSEGLVVRNFFFGCSKTFGHSDTFVRKVTPAGNALSDLMRLRFIWQDAFPCGEHYSLTWKIRYPRTFARRDCDISSFHGTL